MEYNKKDIKDKFKNRTSIGGVYKLSCSGDSKVWLRSTTNLQGVKNRFEFAMKTNLCPEPCMSESWKVYGAQAFSFELLEEIQKGEAQTDKAFAQDVNTLLELYTEKLKL